MLPLNDMPDSFPTFIVDAKNRYDVVLFNNYPGVRHATGDTRRYQVELFKTSKMIYMFSARTFS